MLFEIFLETIAWLVRWTVYALIAIGIAIICLLPIYLVATRSVFYILFYAVYFILVMVYDAAAH